MKTCEDYGLNPEQVLALGWAYGASRARGELGTPRQRVEAGELSPALAAALGALVAKGLVKVEAEDFAVTAEGLAKIAEIRARR